MNRSILTINAGSSSLKFALFSVGTTGLCRAVHGKVAATTTSPHLIARDEKGEVVAEHRWDSEGQVEYDEFLNVVLQVARTQLQDSQLIAVGHRVVHGGPSFSQPVRIDAQVLRDLEALVPLAPLHLPQNLAAVKSLHKLFPDLVQVACFDTAFHVGHEPVIDRYGLPRALEQAGIRKYGFHGLSYEYIAKTLRERFPELADACVVAAHLGNGASLCAMKNGYSVDTTMGFSALDGLVMGSRCGALDPGVVLYLLQEKKMKPEEVAHLLYHESGLLGVSGISSDMQILLDKNDPQAAEAVELFVFRLAREIGALMASLGGLDAIIFTAGIGEHAAQIRHRVCERLGWLKVAIDPVANHAHRSRISTSESAIQILVIPTDEELMIATHTFSIVNRKEVTGMP